MSEAGEDWAALWRDFPELEIYPYGWHAAGELELIELGDRVSDWFSSSMLGAAYSTERDRVQSATLQMIGAVAQRASGPAYPEEWMPEVVRRHGGWAEQDDATRERKGEEEGQDEAVRGT